MCCIWSFSPFFVFLVIIMDGWGADSIENMWGKDSVQPHSTWGWRLEKCWGLLRGLVPTLSAVRNPSATPSIRVGGFARGSLKSLMIFLL